ncbi:MAG: hypothetical protein V6Z81_10390 [Parvularculales bacterium]
MNAILHWRQISRQDNWDGEVVSSEDDLEHNGIKIIWHASNVISESDS